MTCAAATGGTSPRSSSAAATTPSIAAAGDITASAFNGGTLGVTVVVAQWETRDVRAVLNLLRSGRRPDPEQGMRAGRQAVTFPVRHHFYEAIYVPLNSCLPLCLFLAVVD